MIRYEERGSDLEVIRIEILRLSERVTALEQKKARASAGKPWTEAGLSRSTWYRRKKRGVG